MADRGEEGILHVPRNEEAEQLVLGAALLEPDEVIPTVADRLKPEHFYFRAHQIIYRTLLDLFEEGEHADAVAVANRLEERGQLAKVGGRSYLGEMMGRVTTITAVDHYAGIIEDKALRRWLIEAGGKVSELAQQEDLPLEGVMDRAEEAVFAIAERRSAPSFHSLREFLDDHLEMLMEVHKDPHRRPVAALSTGFEEFDALTSGLRRSDLIVLAGRPGTGKTSLALGIVRHAAIVEKKKVGLFSLEMTKEQILERLLCAEAQVDLQRLRDGYLPAAKWGLIAEAAGRLHDAVILVDDASTASVLSIKAKARQMMRRHDGLDLVVVDYLQLVEAGIKSDVREQQIAYISRALKALARELEVPVIACSQLNRAVERRESKRPQLSDLRESGAIEQDADLVVFIYRPDYYDDPDQTGPVAETEIIIAKQRNGPLGKFRLMFHKSSATFYSPTKQGEVVPF
ncbi:MAG TPA: replicative DNA helicase [Candidatus Bipolaricaulis anaerobius]|uniref:replicative DNA helicase n=1 Tax=Candidatus Bipolaricaulis anaerobius TaxID=2026885 RepID=UPI001300264C|nr:replicative DNA helicase [Candidatus Bipolaricaulis anaerobius]MBP7725977.1 replicative DNA helicase [Candidatus Bipolaricaulis sp.]MDD2912150.1 replicative DNA helicase [Candidatus Bipolaricaulis anaerobius]HNR23828.1 replicative DNA helicase [Candidatus Bipolaricaulis anaerobius]HNS24089.1 replicative DNA helicase [Candidatus Bipolaricaulis anaerobius]HQM37531.1 replicative DNA helicase [Candidatus Bipolaricaulis anaerobius]